MRELAEGLWHWTAPHPDWRPGEPWDRDVSSYAMDAGGRLVLFDPLAPPEDIHPLAVVLTCPWHERDTRRLVERFGLPVYAPAPDTAADLMRKFGVTAEQAGSGSPDLAWLGELHRYAAGDRLPFGIEALPGREANDLVLWVEDRRAVVPGDTLVDFGAGLQVAGWLRDAVTREQVVAGLRPLLDRPVEHVLATHGGPFDRAALERALA